MSTDTYTVKRLRHAGRTATKSGNRHAAKLYYRDAKRVARGDRGAK